MPDVLDVLRQALATDAATLQWAAGLVFGVVVWIVTQLCKALLNVRPDDKTFKILMAVIFSCLAAWGQMAMIPDANITRYALAVVVNYVVATGIHTNFKNAKAAQSIEELNEYFEID